MKKLREEEGCDIVIALTHFLLENDVKFAAKVPGIDFVLGGHDHLYHVEGVKSNSNEKKTVAVVKSGADFHEFSDIDIEIGISKDTYNNKLKEISKSKNNKNVKVIYSAEEQMMI